MRSAEGGEGAGGRPGDRRGGGRGRGELLRYAGLSSEVVAAVVVSVYLGIKADKWLRVSFPLLTWLLPLLVIVFLIVKLIKESSGKNNGKKSSS